jgi:hypothetical protein
MRLVRGKLEVQAGTSYNKLGPFHVPDGLHVWWGARDVHVFWAARPHVMRGRDLW